MSGIIVLISGRGSNLAAMCNLGLAKHIKCVISNKASAPGLNIAKEFGITHFIIDHKQFEKREEFDRQIALVIDSFNPQYVILAGFMRILSTWFVNHYAMRLVNIHPSILPAFIGSDAITQAFDAKVKISGATIHFVTDELDNGPIIAQGVIPAILCKNTEELGNRIHALEHVLYPFIIHKLIANKVVISNNGTVVVAKENTDHQLLGTFSNNIFY